MKSKVNNFIVLGSTHSRLLKKFINSTVQSITDHKLDKERYVRDRLFEMTGIIGLPDDPECLYIN